MALPTTNLTLHVDAADASHVWENDARTDAAEDADNVNVWTDEDGRDLAFWYITTAANGPTYKLASSAMVLGSLEFNGSSEYMSLRDVAAIDHKSIDVITNNNAKTVILSLIVKAASLNAAEAYNNHPIIADVGAFWGLYLKGNAGVYTLQHYNWDGNEDKIEKTISLNTTYVVTLRHDGTNIYIGLDGAAETSVASGNTADMTGTARIGGGIASHFANVVIGEIACYDAALASTDLTDANAYFTAKWLAAVAADNAPYIPQVYQQAVARGAFF